MSHPPSRRRQSSFTSGSIPIHLPNPLAQSFPANQSNRGPGSSCPAATTSQPRRSPAGARAPSSSSPCRKQQQIQRSCARTSLAKLPAGPLTSIPVLTRRPSEELPLALLDLRATPASRRCSDAVPEPPVAKGHELLCLAATPTRVAAQPVISAAAEPQDSSAALLFISLPLPYLSPLPCSAPRRHRHGVRRWLPAAALLRRRIRRDPAPTARILPSPMGSASLLRRRHAKPSPSSRSARRSAAEHLPLPASSASSRMRRPLARSSSSVDRAPFSFSFDRVKTQAQPRQAPAGPRPTSPTGLASASVLFILGRASKAQGEPPPTPPPLSFFLRCWASSDSAREVFFFSACDFSYYS